MDPTRIQQLFQFGSYFLYGMLFDFSFSLTDQFMASVEQAQKLVDATDLFHTEPFDRSSFPPWTSQRMADYPLIDLARFSERASHLLKVSKV
jgi:hypothetical protein